jgi:glucose/arabinose dehydrogenase
VRTESPEPVVVEAAVHIPYGSFMRRLLPIASGIVAVAACTSGRSSTGSGGASPATATATTTTTVTTSSGGGGGDGGHVVDTDASIPHPCDLPGSVQFTATGTNVVSGGPAGDPDLTWLHLPVGFCAHYYGTVGNARQLRFAPGGELFVASPTAPTTGGGQDGQAAIVVLPDDDHDGRAAAPVTFLSNLPATQGMMFIPGWFYYQTGRSCTQATVAHDCVSTGACPTGICLDGTKIRRVAYAVGDRAPSGAGEDVVDITYSSDSLHWPKTLDMADDGSIYVGNGGSQGDACVTPHPFKGGIRRIDASTTHAMDGDPVAQGFRNPIAVRCLPGHNTCFALELALDYSDGQGGREKMVPIRTGDDWGFPCCATKNMPYATQPAGTDCSNVTGEDVSWLIGDTPFGLAFAPPTWPGMWSGAAIVATHGTAGSWAGARVVAIAMDPSTGLPLPGTDMVVGDQGSMTDFATGWDNAFNKHGRPAAVEFSPDGRLFIANDTNGVIFWVGVMDP